MEKYGFEICSKYIDADLALPVRKTQASAGYDFEVADDIVIPSYLNIIDDMIDHSDLDLDDLYGLTSSAKTR